MSMILSAWNAVMDGNTTFHGQNLAYKLMTIVLWTSGIVGFIVGFIVQRFVVTFYFIATGAVIATILTVPSWPMFQRHGITWREPQFTAEAEQDASPTEAQAGGVLSQLTSMFTGSRKKVAAD
eukprot:Selendium_serpulae@DN5787_c0_g1_i1.p1